MQNLIMYWFSIPSPSLWSIEFFGYPWWFFTIAIFFSVGTFCLSIASYVMEFEAKYVSK